MRVYICMYHLPILHYWNGVGGGEMVRTSSLNEIEMPNSIPTILSFPNMPRHDMAFTQREKVCSI